MVSSHRKFFVVLILFVGLFVFFKQQLLHCKDMEAVNTESVTVEDTWHKPVGSEHTCPGRRPKSTRTPLMWL